MATPPPSPPPNSTPIVESTAALNANADAANKSSDSLKKTSDMAASVASAFEKMTPFLLSSQSAFNGFDTKSFTTATQQVKNLTEATKTMSEMMPKAFKSAIGSVTGMIGTLGTNFLQNADNALKLQNAYIMLAARTGGLDDVFDKVSKNGGSFNSILAQQYTLMTNAMNATGVSRESMGEYYTMLGTVPKALESTVVGLENSNDRVSMLTASIKIATGTGRAYTDVVKDLHAAFQLYGLTGERALLFTTRFSEISNKFGIELEDVRNGLLGSANAFHLFANAGAESGRMSEGLANIMNNYVGILKAAGMSGRDATNTVTTMTAAMASMRIEQKAFLSMQSGGPGGLMGGFQIEKMMREGKSEEVFEKMRMVMEKQFGKIVTLEDASKSQGAATQFEKQRLMLQKGPLGQFAKTDEEANRVLEAWKAKSEGKATTGLDTNAIQNTMKRGTSIEEKSYTQLTVMSNHLAAIQNSAEITALATLQKNFTTKEGSNPALTAAMAAGGHMPDQDLDPATMSKKTTKDAASWAAGLPAALKATVDAFKKQLPTDTKKHIDEELKKTDAEVKTMKEKASKMTGTEKKKQLDAAQAKEDEAKSNYGWYTGDFDKAKSSGKMMGTAPKTMSDTTGKVISTGTASVKGEPINVNVNIIGECPHCKNKIQVGDHAVATNATTGK